MLQHIQIRKKSLSKFHFPVKLYEIRKNFMIRYVKNVRTQSCSFQTDLQIFSHTVSDKTYIFRFNSKNTIKIQKFHFLDKICEIQKKRLDGKLFA